MPMSRTNYRLLFFAIFLLLVSLVLFCLDWKSSHRVLTFAAMNVGQGDALFIESPTGTQVLFDAGPPRSILGPLSKVMPFYDKKIDALVITNPDADHIGGFEDVMKNYKVDMLLEPGTFNDSKIYQNLKEEIKAKNIPNVLARRGMKMDIGGGAFIEILFPDRDVVDWAGNEGSVVAKLIYGDTSVMLTGDATKETEKIILSQASLAIKENVQSVQSSVLKVGHHGSRTSTSKEFVEAVSPTFAVISDGKNNNYGHPSVETLNLLNSSGIKILRTDILGNILMKSNGKEFTFSNFK